MTSKRTPTSTFSAAVRSETSSDAKLLAALDKVLAAQAEVSTAVADYQSTSRPGLLKLAERVATAQRNDSTIAALVAGEIARQSAPELGTGGMARELGHTSVIELIKTTTGVSGREAATTISVGRIAHEAAGAVDLATGELHAPSEPWLSPAASALTSGALSVAALDAIKRGIGRPAQDVTAAALRAAVVILVRQAKTTDPDRLYKLARQARDEIDTAGIFDREQELHNARSFKAWKNDRGGVTAHWELGIEDGAKLLALRDRITSPKLGGVRFVNEADRAMMEKIQNDPRTPEQLASDAFLRLLNTGADADSSEMLGTGAAQISIVLTNEHAAAIEAAQPGRPAVGAAFIDGQDVPVSLQTVERLLCDAVVLLPEYDKTGMPLDFGREQRLFNVNQRKNMAAKWGGCSINNCDRPPTWCEAHHINQWARDHGRTDIADGLPLCRHHHLTLHNNHWEITRDGSRYWLTRPSLVPGGEPTREELLPKGRAFLDAMRRMEQRTG